MSTSGTYRALEDVDRAHDCGWEGDVLAVRDDEDRTLWWQCPGCSATVTEHHDDDDYDRGSAHPLVLVFLAGLALVIVGVCVPSTFLILIGFAAMLPTPTIGVLAILNRKENDHV